MSREDAVVLASRTLALLLIVWALAEIASLPAYVQLFLHYSGRQPDSASNSNYWEFWRHHYLIYLGFTITKVVGFSLLARWLLKGGPEVAELLLPGIPEDSART